jgi:hypothetical protein
LSTPLICGLSHEESRRATACICLLLINFYGDLESRSLKQGSVFLKQLLEIKCSYNKLQSQPILILFCSCIWINLSIHHQLYFFMYIKYFYWSANRFNGGLFKNFAFSVGKKIRSIKSMIFRIPQAPFPFLLSVKIAATLSVCKTSEIAQIDSTLLV